MQIKMQHFLSWLTYDLCNFLTPRYATFLKILYLWMRYAILIHRYWQLSWGLCFWSSDVIFTLRYTRFLMILWLEQDRQFLLGGYFTFSGYPMKKWIVPINAARIPWPETTKIQKSPKIDEDKTSVMVMMYNMYGTCSCTILNSCGQVPHDPPDVCGKGGAAGDCPALAGQWCWNWSSGHKGLDCESFFHFSSHFPPFS